MDRPRRPRLVAGAARRTGDRNRARRPPLPEDGLQIGQDDAGTRRTYQERYPASTLTAGHATNIEACWACHALREIAAWSTTVDIRTGGGADEPRRCQLARESLAGRVDSVNGKFAHWREPVESAPEAAREIKDVAGLRLARSGRGNWAVTRVIDNRVLLGGIGAQAKATASARALAALGDLATVPGYVLPYLPALRDDVEAIKWEATGLSSEASAWAENCRTRAAEIRQAVAEKAAKDAAWRNR
ncbi:hypothetical protein Franean1_5055 [Parafrankia sp. EAN1pec]|uniref:hypothetical protein n=1 Tax=Parafrankia sp. (strain EAN1pec) TaxID=298653 RepID=UPI0000544A1B|nr:hypothetical protein Franean1_5055 [Frankia sp. EAN1pec]